MSLAGKWDDPALAEFLGRHNRLRNRTAADLQDMAKTILEDLDDLAVLVLFSVFEATVRAQAGADVDREMALIRHVAVLEAVKDLKEAIANGSFAKLTTAFKRKDTDLMTQVNQVRKFRNWVAHGRRGVPENNTTPQDAFDRLRRYLELLAESTPDEPIPPSPSALEPPLSVEPRSNELPPEV
jgi:hypothetical protein